MKLTEMLGLGVQVGAGAAVALTRGLIGTASDAVSVVSCAARRDWDTAGEIVSRRIVSTVVAGASSVDAAMELADSAAQSLSDRDKPFVTEENRQRMVTLATAALAMGLAGSLLDDGVDAGDGDDYASSVRGRG